MTLRRLFVLLISVVFLESSAFGQHKTHRFHNLTIKSGEIENILGLKYDSLLSEGILDSVIVDLRFLDSKFEEFTYSHMLGNIYIGYSDGDTIHFSYKSEVRLEFDSIKYLQLDQVKKCQITASKIGKFKSFHSKYNLLSFEDVSFRSMLSFNYDIFEKVDISKFELPDTIQLVGIDLREMQGAFDLTDFYPTNKICNLVIIDTDASKLKLNYSNLRLIFPDRFRISFEDKLRTYENLLSNFKRNDQLNSYEKLDKEYRYFKYTGNGSLTGWLLNFVDYYWWDYGYNPKRCVNFSIYLTLFFFIINAFFFDSLVYEGYKLKKFIEICDRINRTYEGKVARFFRKGPIAFLYTCYIFWGVILDSEYVGVDKFVYFIYVLIQYIIGMICLAFIAHIILT